LNQSQTYDADGVDDVAEFKEVKDAMTVCGIKPEDQTSIFQIVSGILHLGNVSFVESGNAAAIRDDNGAFCLLTKTSFVCIHSPGLSCLSAGR
jgi:myosin heavy subunit